MTGLKYLKASLLVLFVILLSLGAVFGSLAYSLSKIPEARIAAFAREITPHALAVSEGQGQRDLCNGPLIEVSESSAASNKVNLDSKAAPPIVRIKRVVVGNLDSNGLRPVVVDGEFQQTKSHENQRFSFNYELGASVTFPSGSAEKLLLVHARRVL